MSLLDQSQSIKLGQVLEEIIVPMLNQAGIDYTNSEQYDHLLTRPDFILFKNGKAIASLAITATSTSQAWRMKRWRYIDEVAQLKSYYGEDFLTINVLYADMSLFQSSELAITNAFFDASIIATELAYGEEIIQYATDSVLGNSDLSSNAIARMVVDSDVWEKHKPVFIQALLSCLEIKDTLTKENVFYSIWREEHPNYINKLNIVQGYEYSTAETFLRYTMINSLLLGQEHVKTMVECVQRNIRIPREYERVFKKTKFIIKKRVDGLYFSDAKLQKTIEAGFDIEIYNSLEKNIFTNDAQKYLVRDIQQDDVVQAMIDKVLPFVSDVDLICDSLVDSFVDCSYMGISHDRVWPLDVYASIIQTSILNINRLFTAKYGFQGVSNPVNNFIVKSDYAKNRFSKEPELGDFCHKLADVIYHEISRTVVPSRSILFDRMEKYKIYQLNQQPYLNPLQRYVELILDRNGYQYYKDPVPCLLGAIDGIPSRMQKIEEIYTVKKGERLFYVKCIAGYDGVKDKTREMAARARLLQYTGKNLMKNPNKHIFVYDGVFSKDLQALLILSGWDEIIPILEFESYINRGK